MTHWPAARPGSVWRLEKFHIGQDSCCSLPALPWKVERALQPDVWRYFERGKGKSECKLCWRLYARYSGTTNLLHQCRTLTRRSVRQVVYHLHSMVFRNKLLQELKPWADTFQQVFINVWSIFSSKTCVIHRVVAQLDNWFNAPPFYPRRQRVAAGLAAFLRASLQSSILN